MSLAVHIYQHIINKGKIKIKLKICIMQNAKWIYVPLVANLSFGAHNSYAVWCKCECECLALSWAVIVRQFVGTPIGQVAKGAEGINECVSAVARRYFLWVWLELGFEHLTRQLLSPKRLRTLIKVVLQFQMPQVATTQRGDLGRNDTHTDNFTFCLYCFCIFILFLSAIGGCN